MAHTSQAPKAFADHVDPDAIKVVRKLLGAGHEAYLVGGCVRDLYVGLRPKDFDIATSATPEAVRRIFRNSRIIGRRFRLAHVFFGKKVIETSTFRTAPQEIDADDPFITHDNEWGTSEDDARRRDFTINGLFFDIESDQIVDFVDGLRDLEGRVVRTIGEPVTRFREDPVRMLRAVKFAARLRFEIEPATWDALLQVTPDIARCSRARLLEEIYKLLRSGSAAGSFALMLQSGLLTHVMPDYLTLYNRDDMPGAERLLSALDFDASVKLPWSNETHASGEASEDASGALRDAVLFWRFIRALDELAVQPQQDVSNGLIQAALFAPLLLAADEPLPHPDRVIDDLMREVCTTLGVARRDREFARQILMAHRRVVQPTPRRTRRASISQREYFHDALLFLGISVRAIAGHQPELAQWTELRELRRQERTRQRRKRPRRRGGKSPDASSDPTSE